MDFIKQNIFIVALAFASAMALLASFLRGGGKSVSVTDATLLINRQDAVVIDVRDAAEFATGHLPDAHHLPLAKLSERLAELEGFKDRPIVACCASGVRSAKARDLLLKAGFTKTVSLADGVGAWERAGLPLERAKKEA
ncbi:rhodanese-like domain-containing protein [Azospira sp. I13]|uniref:rhodanese-like domain-containing protein n=1 Tax=Azospira sp. I13 TaxID=1765050 RepID=UPI000D45E950|nr:rhodanese-like domain-containing protein [Azospira sp. I13]GBG02389.1 rhodanese-like domain-containing protein [Azospira sp. I13]